MEKIKVLITKQLSPSQTEYIRTSLGEEFNLISPEEFTEEGILNHIKDVKILLGDNISKDMIEKSEVELIQVPWAGVENLDFELLSNYEVPACNSHSNALAVAEYAVGLLLGIAKKIPYHDDLLRSGDWNRIKKEEKNSEIQYSSYVSNKTIGFIGYGNIGKSIASLMNGFNPSIMAIVSDKTKKYDEVDFIGDSSDLDYVLENADYLVVASALTEETRGMLNKKNLSKMKKTAYIINISRGRVIDEEALYYVLENRLIAGAGIDTWYNYQKEPLDITYPSKKYDFHKLSNIIISPHRAAQIEGEFTYLDDAIDNIKEYNKDKNYKNRLNIKKGY